MANNISGLKTAIITAFGANLDATTVANLRDRFVSAYQGEWSVLVAGGQADNTSNRNAFAAKKVFDYINEIYTAEDVKAKHAAVTPGTPIT